MATLRVSEKEAVARGWIPAPPVQPTEQKTRYIRVPTIEVRKVYRHNLSLNYVLGLLAAWFLGFFMAMVFIK